MLSRQPRPTALRLLLLCLSFRGALGVCERASATECHGASFVPGAQLAGEGYDVVTLRNTGAFAVDMESWRDTDGTCTLCQNRLQGGVRQRLPTSLADWRTLSSCQHSLSSRLFRSAAQLAESAGSTITNDWRLDLSLPDKPGVDAKLVLAGSKSKTVGFGITRSKSDRYSFTSHQFQCRYYQYRVKDKPLLAPGFNHTLSTLPQELNNATRPQYKRLVGTYGTHYLQLVELGGSVSEVTAIRTCKAASEGVTTEEVKDCLSVEAGAKVGLAVTATAGLSRCREMRRKAKLSTNFSQTFSDRETAVTGGQAAAGRDLLFSGNSPAFAHWVETLISEPGAVRYALAPLHHLLPANDPRQENLRRYISEYITLNALSRQCKANTPCPHGSYRSPRQQCACMCREDSSVDRDCCSKEKGLGHLVVMVKEGQDLWGDTMSGTDGYVVVKYGLVQARTNVISNNNNPKWNASLDLGAVRADVGHRLSVEVWDRDMGTRDDLLGSCHISLASGTHPHVCYLKYGKVVLDVTFKCGPHLGGATCRRYTPKPNSMSLGPLLPVSGPGEPPLLKVVFP